MSGDVFLARLLLASAAALLLLGAFAAWSASNAVKKLVGLAITFLGALVAGAALSVPATLLLVCGAIGVAYLIIGASLAVRLHERFDSVEGGAIDAADAADEAAELRS